MYKDKCKLILGTGQLDNLLKNINKTVDKFNITKQMTISGKWHGCHFKKYFFYVLNYPVNGSFGFVKFSNYLHQIFLITRYLIVNAF